MAESTKTLALVFKGVSQKIEPGSLSDGQLQNGSNITSIQEGAFSPRLGSFKFNNTNSFGLLHSMHKLALGGPDSADPRYMGVGSQIWRVTALYTTYTQVATGLISSTKRWEAVPYYAGSGGNPTLFIAHPDRMMRDAGAEALLRPWGILPVVQPVTAVLGAISSGTGLKILTDQSSGTNRLASSVASAISIGTSYWKVTPTTMAGILPGMLVRFGGSDTEVIDSATSADFNVYDGATPATTINSFYLPVDIRASTLGTVAHLLSDGDAYYHDFNFNVDWSFNGDPTNGYDGTDPIHFGLYSSGPLSYIQSVFVRFFVNGSSNDWYQVTYQGSDMPPTLPVNGSWVEFDVPKNQFTAYGQAGNGAYSWKNVSRFEVWVQTNLTAGTPTFDVFVGACYAVGGGGPDSSATTAFPYKYVVTGRNPITGEEGNPSPLMIDLNAIAAVRRAIVVTCPGLDSDPITGNSLINGYGSLAIYRAGGAFADSLYRFVGYSTNPGYAGGSPNVPNTVTFTDNSPDALIATNRTVEFDNYPPVPSDLPTPFIATISAISSTGPNQIVTITPSVTGLTGLLTKGSEIIVGGGTTQEIAAICDLTATTITCYVQFGHNTGEPLEVDFVVGKPCDVVCQYGDALIVAGDPNNPHKVYRSKSGAPHAFPVQNLETGFVHIQNVTSPDNPVTGLVSFNSELVCLTVRKVILEYVWQGQWQDPQDAPSSRGMVAKHLFCKSAEFVAFLSYDGVYIWQGGQAQKISIPLDWVFNSDALQVGNFTPLDYTNLPAVEIKYFQSFIWILYVDTSAANRGFRYSIQEQRWEAISWNGPQQPEALTALLPEYDTGRLIGGVYQNAPFNRSFLHQLETGTSDSTTTGPTGGNQISWEAQTGFMGLEGRNLLKQFTEIQIECLNPSDPFTIKLYYDYATVPDAIDTFVIGPNAVRSFAPFPLQQLAGIPQGKEARVVAIEFVGVTVGPVAVYSVHLAYNLLAEVQRGRITDWVDNGHPWDKRLYAITLDYNVYGTTGVFLVDIIGGPGGTAQQLAVATLTLTGAGRSQQEFPIPDGIIYKKLRIRPETSSHDFIILSWLITDEKYPADAVFFTEYDDCGSPFPKYLQQILLDVNTNGQTVPFQIEVDGAFVESFTVTSTLHTRQQIITINPSLLGRKFRILVGAIPATGMWQLWKVAYVTQPADKGPVVATTDFDSLGYQFPKKLKQLTIEYDQSSGTTQVVVDTIASDGVTVTLVALTFTLSGTGIRSEQTFPIPDGYVVQAIRIRPIGTLAINFQMWKYKCDFDPYPATTTLWTEQSDLGWPFEKIFRSWQIEVNTGGVAASVNVVVDGNVVQTVSIMTTDADRGRIITMPSNIIGIISKLDITPGSEGIFQIFSGPQFVFIKEPPKIYHWDSYEVTLGYLGWKVIKQGWLEYICAVGLIVRIYVENDVLFQTINLPSHAHRDVERFSLPPNAGSTYNKSRSYRITIDSADGATVFKVYLDSSRIESLNLSNDQRAAYAQFPLSEFTQLKVS